MADHAGTTLRSYGCCPEYSEIFPSETEAGRFRADLGRTLNGPDGSDATCQDNRIRELVVVRTARCVAVE